MPQPRAVGRTAAGRTNRSLTTPRRSDGAFQSTLTQRGTSKEEIPSSSASQAFSSTSGTVHPALSATLLMPLAASSSARMPRSTLSVARGYADRRSQPMQTHWIHTNTQTATIQGTAPERIPAHIRKAQEEQQQQQQPQPHPPSSSSSRVSDSVRLAMSSMQSVGSTHVGPSTLSDFGDGSGVAGTRGQRWIPKKGVTDFLSKLHSASEANHVNDDADTAASLSTTLSPAELHSSNLMSPAHFKSRVDLSFANIRPETPSCKVKIPNNNRVVHQVKRGPSSAELKEKQAHEQDLRVVRDAIRALGREAGDLNQRTWWKGVDSIRGNSTIERGEFIGMLPQLGLHLTPQQESLLLHLTFGGATRCDFLTLIPRLQGDRDYHASETQPYLDYWKHLPLPDEKQDPTPTAMSTLQKMKDKIETRGVNAFLASMGFSSRIPLPREQFARAIKQHNIHLPSHEQENLFRLLDPSHTGLIDWKQFFRLAEIPTHQLGNHHRLFKTLERVANGKAEQIQQDESKENVSGATDNGGTTIVPARGDLSVTLIDRSTPRDHTLPPRGTTTATTPHSVTFANDSSSSPSSRRTTSSIDIPKLPLSVTMAPPLFQSVHSARTAPIGRIGSPVAGSQSARTDVASSVYHPRPGPGRFSLTHAPVHTPITEFGGVGRPISATTRRQVDQQRARKHLPPIQTVTLAELPTYAIGARAAMQPDGSIPSTTVRRTTPPSYGISNDFFSNESERFTPRDVAIETMQRADRERKSARLQRRFDRLDSSEQRVLRAYEEDELIKQSHAARSIVDKIQQKRAYFNAIQEGTITTHHSKRIVNQVSESQLIEMGYLPETTTATTTATATTNEPQ